jgi:hypothetical protein
LLHLIPLNFALFLVYNSLPDIASLIYSFIILLLFFILTFIFTKPKANINYVYNSDFLGFSIPCYKFLGIFLFFIFVVLPTYAVQYILYFAFH